MNSSPTGASSRSRTRRPRLRAGLVYGLTGTLAVVGLVAVTAGPAHVADTLDAAAAGLGM